MRATAGGRLKYFSCGPYGCWGVNSQDNVYFNPEGGSFPPFSCGPYGCWGVNSQDNVYFNPLQSTATCSFSGWKHIEGGLKMIEVGSDGHAFGLNSSGNVYERTGISKELPEGRGWQFIPCLGTMTQISYDLDTIYGVTSNGVIMKATA